MAWWPQKTIPTAQVWGWQYYAVGVLCWRMDSWTSQKRCRHIMSKDEYVDIYRCRISTNQTHIQMLTKERLKKKKSKNPNWPNQGRFLIFTVRQSHVPNILHIHTYSLICFLQGTEFLMQVPVSLSTSSTMTKGFSSKVTMDRWLSSSSASPKELKRGHTGYFIVRLPLSSFPIWWEGDKNEKRKEKKRRL